MCALISNTASTTQQRKRRYARKAGESREEVELVSDSVWGVSSWVIWAVKQEHTVIGSTVNLACRLCSAKGGEIVIHQNPRAHRETRTV